MPPHVRYLHGFASGPSSQKGTALGQALAGCCASFAIPDLEGGDFTGLTVTRMAARAIAACPPGERTVLVGSSLGGWLAAWLAAESRVPGLTGLLLIAPAFGFTMRWAERLGVDGVAAWRRAGQRLFFHHGQQREVPLSSAFLDDCERVPPVPGPPGVPCVIIHGRQDDTVPAQVSLDYVRTHPEVELHLVQGDHRLTEPRHAALIAHLAADLLART